MIAQRLCIFLHFLLQCTNPYFSMSSSSMLLTPTTIVDALNAYRMAHGAQKATWSPALAASAASWATTLAKKNALAHSSFSYGENVAQLYARDSTSEDAMCSQAIAMWYAEAAAYDYAAATYSPATGHFTQVVWNASTAIGAGVATSTAGYAFVVMEFDPPGNYLGMFRQNVFPKLATLSLPLPPPPIASLLAPPPSLSPRLKIPPPMRTNPKLPSLVAAKPPSTSPVIVMRRDSPPPAKKSFVSPSHSPAVVVQEPLSLSPPPPPPPLADEQSSFFSPTVVVHEPMSLSLSPPPPSPSPLADKPSSFFSPSILPAVVQPPPFVVVAKQSTIVEKRPPVMKTPTPSLTSKSSPPRLQPPFKFIFG